MNILILNWRDIKNPLAGGAELLTHKIAKRWVKLGNQVVQISAGFSGGGKKETVDGVEVIRLGTWWSIHFLAFLYYIKNLRNKIDIIIDEVHWFPFFARIYAPKKTVLLACEVANKLFYKVFPYPLALIFRIVEKIYFYIYKNVPTLAISPSTRKELVKEGFDKEKITIIPMGITVPQNIRKYPKEKNPTIIYLGRINKLKGAEDAVVILENLKEKIPNVKLWFVGSGKREYVKNIKQQITNSKLGNSVVFYGYVSDEKKFELLARAHLLIVPSIHEGWGLVVVEAGIVGTPAVVYNVAGLKDVVRNGVNGIIAESTPIKIAKEIIGILRNKKNLQELSRGAVSEAKNYSWEETARSSLEVIKKQCKT